MVLRTRNGAKLCERPACARGMPRPQPRPKTSAPTTPSQNRPAEKGQNEGWAIALVGGWGEVGPPDWEWAKLCDRPPCARGMPRVQPRPKTSTPTTPSQNRPVEKGQNGGCAIALVGGCGEGCPPDSKWGQTLLAAFVCPRDAPGAAAPKNERPKAPVPKPPIGKGPKRGVCYSLGWGGAKLVRRTRNGAKLCERPPCARGMPRAQPRPKTSARRPPSQNRPAEKGQNGGCAIALVGGWG